LWQADFKLGDDDFWMISYQDDHSRFITGSIKIWNPTGENAMLLDRAVRKYGVPQQILTDQVRSLSLHAAEFLHLDTIAQNWALNILLQVCADPHHLRQN
jgi:hypothetical protein